MRRTNGATKMATSRPEPFERTGRESVAASLLGSLLHGVLPADATGEDQEYGPLALGAKLTGKDAANRSRPHSAAPRTEIRHAEPSSNPEPSVDVSESSGLVGAGGVPHWGTVAQAFLDGAREARQNPTATEADFKRAADGYTKLKYHDFTGKFSL